MVSVRFSNSDFKATEISKKASNSTQDERMKKAFAFDLSMTKGQRSNILNSKRHTLLQLFNAILELPCILLVYRFTATTSATMEKNPKYNKVRYLYLLKLINSLVN